MLAMNGICRSFWCGWKCCLANISVSVGLPIVSCHSWLGLKKTTDKCACLFLHLLLLLELSQELSTKHQLSSGCFLLCVWFNKKIPHFIRKRCILGVDTSNSLSLTELTAACGQFSLWILIAPLENLQNSQNTIWLLKASFSAWVCLCLVSENLLSRALASNRCLLVKESTTRTSW